MHKFLDDTFLDEIMDQYNEGYEKTYKYIPDLIEELRDTRKQLDTAKMAFIKIAQVIHDTLEIEGVE